MYAHGRYRFTGGFSVGWQPAYARARAHFHIYLFINNTQIKPLIRCARIPGRMHTAMIRAMRMGNFLITHVNSRLIRTAACLCSPRSGAFVGVAGESRVHACETCAHQRVCVCLRACALVARSAVHVNEDD